MVVRDLGLADTLWGILLPGFAGAFGVFLLRQAFLNIPAELGAVARIDGCGSWGILLNVILPLSKPALITPSGSSRLWVHGICSSGRSSC